MDFITAIAGACGVAFGAAVQAVVAWLNNKATHEENSADMLHEAQTELKDTMADMNLLWEHNRALITTYTGARHHPRRTRPKACSNTTTKRTQQWH